MRKLLPLISATTAGAILTVSSFTLSNALQLDSQQAHSSASADINHSQLSDLPADELNGKVSHKRNVTIYMHGKELAAFPSWIKQGIGFYKETCVQRYGYINQNWVYKIAFDVITYSGRSSQIGQLVNGRCEFSHSTANMYSDSPELQNALLK